MDILSPQQLEELKQFDAPTICNAIECFNLIPRTAGFAMPFIFPRTSENAKMIGYAVTAVVSARHPAPKGADDKVMAYYKAVRETPGPAIAVIRDIDPQPMGSFWGEVQATIHKSLGAIGTLTQGGVRDLEEAGRMGFHFFASHVLVSHAYIHMVDQGGGVDIAGLQINPGDLIFADRHGVVGIPHAAAPRLAEACRDIADAELPMLEPCRKAIAKGEKPGLDQLREWRKAMDAARKKATEKFG